MPHAGTPGADVLTTNGPVQLGGGSNGGWWHIAAVFDKPFTNITVAPTAPTSSPLPPMPCGSTSTASVSPPITPPSRPVQTLDPALSPGDTIGSRSRYDWTEPFYGFMDEITAYARALTDPEIAAIAAAGPLGKADPAVPAAQSLAELSVAVDGTPLGHGLRG